jgi:hypothetical protein
MDPGVRRDDIEQDQGSADKRAARSRRDLVTKHRYPFFELI